jgi:hypothetical protein
LCCDQYTETAEVNWIVTNQQAVWPVGEHHALARQSGSRGAPAEERRAVPRRRWRTDRALLGSAPGIILTSI